MRDVAALAGRGRQDRLARGQRVPTVAPDLAERVRSAADKLGYRPNLTAANLRRTGGRTNTIGLLLEDVSNPYSSAVFRAVEDYARERSVLVLAASLDEDPRRERELARKLIDRRVDGLIIMPAAARPPVRDRRAAGRHARSCSSTGCRRRWWPTRSSRTTGAAPGRPWHTCCAPAEPGSPTSATT